MLSSSSINLGLKPFLSAFGMFHVALGLWLGMQGLSTMVYFAFKMWAHTRWYLVKSEYSLSYKYDIFLKWLIFTYRYNSDPSLGLVRCYRLRLVPTCVLLHIHKTLVAL